MSQSSHSIPQTIILLGTQEQGYQEDIDQLKKSAKNLIAILSHCTDKKATTVFLWLHDIIKALNRSYTAKELLDPVLSLDIILSSAKTAFENLLTELAALKEFSEKNKTILLNEKKRLNDFLTKAQTIFSQFNHQTKELKEHPSEEAGKKFFILDAEADRLQKQLYEVIRDDRSWYKALWDDCTRVSAADFLAVSATAASAVYYPIAAGILVGFNPVTLALAALFFIALLVVYQILKYPIKRACSYLVKCCIGKDPGWGRALTLEMQLELQKEKNEKELQIKETVTQAAIVKSQIETKEAKDETVKVVKEAKSQTATYERIFQKLVQMQNEQQRSKAEVLSRLDEQERRIVTGLIVGGEQSNKRGSKSVSAGRSRNQSQALTSDESLAAGNSSAIFNRPTPPTATADDSVIGLKSPRVGHRPISSVGE